MIFFFFRDELLGNRKLFQKTFISGQNFKNFSKIESLVGQEIERNLDTVEDKYVGYREILKILFSFCAK